MSPPRKPQDPRLARARAYYRLSMRSDMPFEHYRRVADQLVAEVRRDKEARERRKRAEVEAKARWLKAHPKKEEARNVE